MKKSKQELERLMGQTQSEYSIAIRKLRELERDKMMAEAKTTIIVTAKRHDLIKDPRLKEHFTSCCKDEKFKPTVDFIKSCIYIEHEKVVGEYNAWEQQAKQAEKEFAMLTSQMINYHSENKQKVAELMNKL